MKIYENNRGFQLGNLLYLLLQAHRDRMMGYEESYVLRTGYFQFAQTFFPKTAVLFSKANGIELEDFGYFQEAGVDYSSEELDSFCREYLIEPVVAASAQFEEKNVTIAIRRTDFLNERNRKNYGYNSQLYICSCLDKIAEIEGADFQHLTIRITSDDVAWCREELVPFLHSQYHFENPIIVEEQDIQDNFLQLYSCNKYFICPNSTYCYWVGYILRLVKPFVKVFVPDFNTLLEQNGKQIADTRDWEVVSVDRTGFE